MYVLGHFTTFGFFFLLLDSCAWMYMHVLYLFIDMYLCVCVCMCVLNAQPKARSGRLILAG